MLCCKIYYAASKVLLLSQNHVEEFRTNIETLKEK